MSTKVTKAQLEKQKQLEIALNRCEQWMLWYYQLNGQLISTHARLNEAEHLVAERGQTIHRLEEQRRELKKDRGGLRSAFGALLHEHHNLQVISELRARKAENDQRVTQYLFDCLSQWMTYAAVAKDRANELERRSAAAQDFIHAHATAILASGKCSINDVRRAIGMPELPGMDGDEMHA